MGRDKALLPFGGYQTLMEYQFRRLEPLFSQVAISLKEDKLPFQAPIVYDRAAISAPLVALVAILEAAGCDRVFVIAVDTPFFSADAIAQLLSVEAPVVMARTPSGTHPLAAIYHRSVLPVFKEALTSGELALHRALKGTSVVYVDFEERLLMNLNHPHEYEAAQCVSA